MGIFYRIPACQVFRTGNFPNRRSLSSRALYTFQVNVISVRRYTTSTIAVIQSCSYLSKILRLRMAYYVIMPFIDGRFLLFQCFTNIKNNK